MPGIVEFVVCSRDGRTLAVASQTHVTIHDAAHLPAAPDLRGEATDKGQMGIVGLALSPDGTALVAGLNGSVKGTIGELHFWDLVAEKETHVVPVPGDRLGRLDLSANGHTLAVATGQKVNLLDADRREPMRTLEGHLYPVNAVCFAPVGDALATTSGDNTFRIWNSATGEVRHDCRGTSPLGRSRSVPTASSWQAAWATRSNSGTWARC